LLVCASQLERRRLILRKACHEYFCLPACLICASRINPRLRVLGVIAAAGAVPCFSVDHMRLMSRTLEKFTCEPVGPDEQNVIG
jgi:hypothetical protein